MSERSLSFHSQLGILTIIFSVLALITGFIPVLAPYATIFWLSIALYVIFSLVVHFFAKKAAMSSNKLAFTNVTIGSMAGKLFLSIFLIVLYKKLAAPADDFFVVPFLLVYLCYTIFETNFMMKLSRIDKNESGK